MDQLRVVENTIVALCFSWRQGIPWLRDRLLCRHCEHYQQIAMNRTQYARHQCTCIWGSQTFIDPGSHSPFLADSQDRWQFAERRRHILEQLSWGCCWWKQVYVLFKNVLYQGQSLLRYLKLLLLEQSFKTVKLFWCFTLVSSKCSSRKARPSFWFKAIHYAKQLLTAIGAAREWQHKQDILSDIR